MPAPPPSPVMKKAGGPPIGAVIPATTNRAVYLIPSGPVNWPYPPNAVSPYGPR